MSEDGALRAEIKRQINEIICPSNTYTNGDYALTLTTSREFAAWIYKNLDNWCHNSTCCDDCLWCAVRWLNENYDSNGDFI